MKKLIRYALNKFGFDIVRMKNSNETLSKHLINVLVDKNIMHDVYDVLKKFHNRGYFISGLYLINRDESLAVIEYDCVLVKILP